MKDDIRPMVRRTLAHWHTRAETVDEGALAAFERNQTLLRSIITQCAADDEFQLSAAALLCKLRFLIERRGLAEGWMPVAALCLETLPDGLPLRWDVALFDAYMCTLARQFTAAETRLLSMVTHQDVPEMIRAEALLYLGNCYWDMGRLTEADDYSHNALQAFLALGKQVPTRKLASTATLQGLIAAHMREVDSAEIHFEYAVACWEAVQDAAFLARTLNNWAELYIDAGRFEDAWPLLEKALMVVAATDSDLDTVRIYLNRGTYFYVKGAYEQALDAFRKADSDALRNSAETFLQAHVDNNLGGTLLKLGELTMAKLHLKAAIRRWEQLGDRFMWANTLSGLATLLHQQGEGAEAVQLLHKALSLMDTIKATPRVQVRRQQLQEQLEALANGK